jgi:hypothetical protein
MNRLRALPSSFKPDALRAVPFSEMIDTQPVGAIKLKALVTVSNPLSKRIERELSDVPQCG